jgi:hypothetical protein
MKRVIKERWYASESQLLPREHDAQKMKINTCYCPHVDPRMLFHPVHTFQNALVPIVTLTQINDSDSNSEKHDKIIEAANKCADTHDEFDRPCKRRRRGATRPIFNSHIECPNCHMHITKVLYACTCWICGRTFGTAFVGPNPCCPLCQYRASK